MSTPQTLDIGVLQRLKIRCISETGWFDTATVFGDIRDAGGAETDQVDGGTVLYANLQNQGLTMVTGCGHGGVLNLLDYARWTFAGGERIHAICGGLHISPLEDWDEAREQVVKTLSQYGIAKVACNHCTGRTAVEKMLELGLPVVRGTARHGSQTNLFVGNGDVLELG